MEESQTSCANTPEQNEIVECKSRHLLEVTGGPLLQINVPEAFWSNFVHTIAFLIT